MYANVDASGVDLSPLAPNDTLSSPLYNFAAPWPPGSAMPAQATCRYGPCINTCCTGDAVTGACTDNLAADGGHYQTSARPAVSHMSCHERHATMPRCVSEALHRHMLLRGCHC